MTQTELIIIGGGPAGLIAAGQAASAGIKTLLLEKMQHPGRKLGITGKGRCNLTNIAPINEFIPHFGKNGRFLRQAFSRFFSAELLDFLKSQGIETETERGGRVFPVSNQAQEIVDALERWARTSGVTLMTQRRVVEIFTRNNQISGVRTQITGPHGKPTQLPAEEFGARAVILATGGASYPGTGSTGDGYDLARQLGHEIIPVRPALIPLETAGTTAQQLQGVSLRNVAVQLYVDGKKTVTEFGEMLFTHFGLSGPIILTLSKLVVEALQAQKRVSLSIDLKPALDHAKLDARLVRDLTDHNKQQIKSILKELLPAKMIPVCLELTEIPEDKPGHQISAAERKRLRLWLKDFQFEITGHRPLAEAIITAGGVNLAEIDPRTLGSRKIQGLFFAGEVLDLDADTGGYNLQAAFSTGWLAGKSAAEWIQFVQKESLP